MNTLRLEELESRQLLSAAYVAPQPPSRQPVPGNQPMWIAPPARGDGFAGPSGPNWSDIGGAPMIQPWGPAPQSFEPSAAPMIQWIVITFNPTEHDSAGTTGGTNGGDAVGINPGTSRPTETDPGAIAAVADIVSPHATIAATAARPISQAPFMLVPPVTIPTTLAEVQGPIASPLVARTIRPGDGMVGMGAAVLSQGSAPTGAATPIVEDTEPIEVVPAEPAGPNLLAALPTIDLTSLGHGLQRFLDRIEHASEELVGDGDGLRPWLVAGAAAATACEIARRQLARSKESDVRSQIPGGRLPVSDL